MSRFRNIINELNEDTAKLVHKYQEENDKFIDDKPRQISEAMIEPMYNLVVELNRDYDELKRVLDELKDKNMISEN